VEPGKFIGNKIGATLFASTVSELKKHIDSPRFKIGESDFGKRFLGSTKNVLKIIESLSNK